MWSDIKRKVFNCRDRTRRWLGCKVFDYSPHVTKDCYIPDCQRVVFVRWDAKLGDAIVSSFMFRELRKINPEISIEVITTSAMASLFTEQWQADRVYVCKKRPKYRELYQLAKEIGDIDLLINFTNSFKLKDLFFLNRLKPKHIAALDDTLACVDVKLRQACEGLHFADKFAMLLSRCGVSQINTDYWIPFDARSEKAVAEAWPRKYRKVVAVNPFGAGASRRLSEASIIKLFRLLLSETSDIGFCLLYSPAEKALAMGVEAYFAGDRVFTYQQCGSIHDVIAQIRAADGLISVDTATVHIASGLKRPLLGLYNPGTGNYRDWGPNNEKSFTVFSTDRYDINQLSWGEISKVLPSFVNMIRD